MTDLVRISATAAGLAYYPEHIARGLGYFEDEGLDVRVEAPGHGHWVPNAVRTGAAELGLGGIWRPILYRNKLDNFMPFVCIVQRCPAVLLAHEPMPDFRWSDLIGKRVAIGEGAPSSHIPLFAVLKENGIDPASVKTIRHFLAQEARELFLGGVGQFYVASAPAADALVAGGKVFQVADFAVDAGPLPWSVYYSTPAFLETRRDSAIRFASATQRALNWIHGHDPEEAIAVLEKGWPAVPVNLTLAAARRAKANQMWPATVRLSEEQLSRWQAILIDYGLFDEPLAYAEIFDDGPALAAIAKYPPAAA